MVAVLDPRMADAAIEAFAKGGDKPVRLGEVVAADGGAIAFNRHLDLAWPQK
jgi:hypothetical protein